MFGVTQEDTRLPSPQSKAKNDRFYRQMVEREWVEIEQKICGKSEFSYEEFESLMLENKYATIGQL